MGLFDKWKEKLKEPTEKQKMFSGAMVLVYNLTKETGMEFQIMCEDLGVEMIYVEPKDYLQPIGYLAEIPGVNPVEEDYEGEGFTEIMAVMKNFTGMSMMNFKDRMKRTHGVSTFDLEVNINDKNLNMNSIEIRDLLAEKKEAARQARIAAREAAKAEAEAEKAAKEAAKAAKRK